MFRMMLLLAVVSRLVQIKKAWERPVFPHNGKVPLVILSDSVYTIRTTCIYNCLTV